MAARKASWGHALVPLYVSAVVDTLFAWTLAARHRTALATAYEAVGPAAVPLVVERLGSAFFSVVGVLIAFWLPTIALLAVALLVSGTGKMSRQLIECAALAWNSQVLGDVIVLITTWWWYEPPTFVASPSEAAILAYQEAIANVPLMQSLTLVTLYFRCWYVALLAGAVRAMCGVSTFTAWTIGFFLASLLYVGPWIAGL